MESGSLPTTTSTTEDYDSPSSLVVETTISDSQEQLITNENTETSVQTEKERKLRRLNRRKALAMETNPLPTPMLGRVLKSDNNTIDLTNDDDDPDTQWFKKQFNNPVQASNTKSPKEAKQFAVPYTTSKNAPRSLLIRDTLKKKLQASMSIKRRKDQEQRRKMYEEDNEHLKPPSEDEEDDVIIKKKKAVKPKKPVNDDEYNSEDDEDYKEEDSPPENSSEDESGDESSKQKKQSGEPQARADDEMSVNFLDDSFTYDVFNDVKRPGPGSTVSSFDTRSQSGDVEKSASLPFPGMEMGGDASNDLDDILNLCSGKFDTGPKSCKIANERESSDTLQLLTEDAQQPQPLNFNVEKTLYPDDSDNEEERVVKKKPVKASRALDSDDEDEVVEETPQQEAELIPSLDPFESDKLTETVEEVEKTVLRRVVVSGDEESDDEAEKEENEDEEEEEEEEEDQVEDEEDLGNEEEEEPAADEPEPNFDDEDDELAVLKRIEHQEYKQKMKKKTFFDDEASLSGDDVGSDLEDDDGMNLYEAEEGDADDVPDDDTIRRQNHKLLLKQESDREQRALAKLQDRLLADGDLGGVETNRQFRFRLREEVNVKLTEGEGVEEEQEDDEAEDSEEKKKERAQMIKFKIDHAEELMLLNDPEEDNDLFKRAGQIMKKTEKVVVEASEEITIKSRTGKPSLLSKSALAVSFQEVLTGGSGAAPKQMYVQNIKPSADVSDSTPSSRLSTGGIKRNRQSPDHPAAKRVRQSKLSSLE